MRRVRFTLLAFHSLYPFHISIPFTSLSLSPLSLSLSLYLSLYLSFSLSLFSLSFSLAYLMDVFVLVYILFHIVNITVVNQTQKDGTIGIYYLCSKLMYDFLNHYQYILVWHMTIYSKYTSIYAGVNVDGFFEKIFSPTLKMQAKGCQLKNFNFFQKHIAQLLYRLQSRFVSILITTKFVI